MRSTACKQGNPSLTLSYGEGQQSVPQNMQAEVIQSHETWAMVVELLLFKEVLQVHDRWHIDKLTSKQTAYPSQTINGNECLLTCLSHHYARFAHVHVWQVKQSIGEQNGMLNCIRYIAFFNLLPHLHTSSLSIYKSNWFFQSSNFGSVASWFWQSLIQSISILSTSAAVIVKSTEMVSCLTNTLNCASLERSLWATSATYCTVYTSSTALYHHSRLLSTDCDKHWSSVLPNNPLAWVDCHWVLCM